MVTWNAVDGATSYTVKVSAGDVEPVMIASTEPSLTDEVLGEFKFEVGKNYTLQLMANGASLSSKWSEEFVVKKLLAPTELKIEATNEKVTYTDANSQVVTINVGDPILRWSNPNIVSSEHKFALNYGDGSEEIIIHKLIVEVADAIDYVRTKDLILVPNPVNANSTLYVEADFTANERKDMLVEVFNAVGQCVYAETPVVYPIAIDGLTERGVYVVRIITGEGTMYQGKVVVK